MMLPKAHLTLHSRMSGSRWVITPLWLSESLRSLSFGTPLQPWNYKTLAPWKKSYDQPRQHIKKQRHCSASKGLSSQSYGFSSSYVWMWELDHKQGWVLKNCGVGEDSWESLRLQGDQTSPSKRKSVLNIHVKDWCWSSNSNPLAMWYKELTH